MCVCVFSMVIGNCDVSDATSVAMPGRGVREVRALKSLLSFASVPCCAVEASLVDD